MTTATAPAATVPWSPALLAELRLEGDPVADDLVAKLHAKGDIGKVGELLTTLVHNDTIPATGLDADVYAYLRDTADLPVRDPALIRGGQDLFEEHGNLVLFSLIGSSLPECYTMKAGIEVLWLTQQLEVHVLRRLLATAQMVLRVMTPGGLEPGGAGAMAAAKVRLMHAAIRRLILHQGAPPLAGSSRRFADVLLQQRWDVETSGTPINQADLVFTLLTFSHVIPRSLVKLGIAVSDAQREAFIHTWNVVGEIMGIRRELLPANFAQAEALFNDIKRRQGGATQPGKRMTAAVLGCLDKVIPIALLDFLSVLLMRELLDDETCAMLSVPPPSPAARFVRSILAAERRLAAFIRREVHASLVIAPRLWHALSRRMMTFLTNYEQPRGWTRHLFAIPEHLAARWRLEGHR